jgi:methyltransferase family protein
MRRKDVVKSLEAVPGLLPTLRRSRREVRRLIRIAKMTRDRRPPDQVFREIFSRQAWGGVESVSGPGSDSTQTRLIEERLPELWQRYGVRRLVDVPCGDFRWMKRVVSHLSDYVGLDIVDELVAQNAQYESPQIKFIHADITSSPIPRADMILCRDCLVHLPFREIRQAIDNLKRSGSTYLLTTTFPLHDDNEDIVIGDWRTLNFERPPFLFPAPLEVINEGCTEWNGDYWDKSLALWKIADL